MEDRYKEETKEIVREFLNASRVRELSEETLYSWKHLLKPYFEYLEERQLPFDRVGREEAEEYLLWVQKRRGGGRTYSRGSLANFLKPVKAFYRYQEKKGSVHSNPFAFPRKRSDEKKVIRHVLKEREMKLLLDRLRCFYLGKRHEKRSRYVAHVACEVLYSTGMRLGELSELLVYDIDLERKEILLRKTKNGHPRKVFLNEYTAGVLRIYLTQIRPLLVPPDEETLLGKNKNSLRKALYHMLEKVCAEAGIKRITCHGFRHAFGYHFLSSGCELRYIQNLLGHRYIGSTEIYTKVEKEDLKKVLDTYHPRGNE
jgi:integrase/recombinase XerD